MINNHRVGLAVGTFVGLVHLIWSVLVAVRLAQPLMDFILRLHFVEMSHTVGTFQLGTAVILIIVATVVGYIVGVVFGSIWNWAHKGMPS